MNTKKTCYCPICTHPGVRGHNGNNWIIGTAV